MRPRRMVIILAALLAGNLALQAQVTTGNIIGTVHDQSGAVLLGVTATVTSPDLPGGQRSVVTNEQGQYRFAGLQPGTYTLNVELPGFSTYRETDLRVLAAGTTGRIVTLQVATVAETIEVSGQAPVVDVRAAGIQNSLPAKQLEAAASERYGVQAYMAMLPGVTTNTYNRVWQVTVMGSNSNETTILSDGVSINNAASGGSWLLADFDSAQEVSATTLGASAEYQAAGGGVLQMISKSGTNQFHGDASGYWSPDKLTSKPVMLPCARCGTGVNTGFRWYKYRDLSGHIGGPIIRDRLWFFGGLIYRARSGSGPGDPTPPDNEKFLDMITDLNTKLNWRITDRLEFQQSFYAEIFGTVNPAFTTPMRPIATLQHSEGGAVLNGNWGSQLTWTLSPKTLVTGRYNITQGGSNRIGFFRDLTTPQHRDQFTGLFSANFTATRFRPRRDEVSAKVNTYISGSHVSHNLFYGVQISRNKDYRVDIQPGGVIYLDLSGQPDQAQFAGPDVRGAVSKAKGTWAEDEMNIGRFTLRYGGRFDRMVASSQDVPQFDGKFNEVGTLKGLGKLVTWNTFSPRGGMNIRLTSDAKTVLRVVGGRYYLPLYLSEFEVLHPGRAVTTTMRFDPATQGYTTLVSVTDPRTQIRIDPNMRAPYTDQFSVGGDREVANNLALGMNLVYKRSRNQLGWRDIGGVYGQQQVTLANGQALTVYPLLNRPADRIFLRTNGSGYGTTYKALILTATRRFANRYQFTAGYTRQRATGLDLSSGNAGQDPNDLINAKGGLSTRDRPNMFSLMGSYEIPRIAVQISGNLTAVSGAAVASTAPVRLSQGTRSINLEAPGSKYRTESEQYLHMRITKILFREGPRRLELAGEIKNALQEKGGPDIQTTVFNAPNFLAINLRPEPRQLRLFARWFF
jgi:carboxypeptidase family protein